VPEKCGGEAQVSTHSGQCCSWTRSSASEFDKIRGTVFPSTRYVKNIDTHYNVTGFDVSLQHSSGIDVDCSQQAAET
jgi:hypothetical protein